MRKTGPRRGTSAKQTASTVQRTGRWKDRLVADSVVMGRLPGVAAQMTPLRCTSEFGGSIQ